MAAALAYSMYSRQPSQLQVLPLSFLALIPACFPISFPTSFRFLFPLLAMLLPIVFEQVSIPSLSAHSPLIQLQVLAQ
jgi:hypothetical protein